MNVDRTSFIYFRQIFLVNPKSVSVCLSACVNHCRRMLSPYGIMNLYPLMSTHKVHAPPVHSRLEPRKG